MTALFGKNEELLLLFKLDELGIYVEERLNIGLPRFETQDDELSLVL